jgi:hypothetical protein
MEHVGRKWQESGFWTWLIGFAMVIIVAVVYIFAWLGLYQATTTTADLHVPIFGLSTAACTGVAVTSASVGPVTIVPPPGPVTGAGTGAVVPTALAACAKFAVIAANDSVSTFASLPLIAKLRLLYPLSYFSSHSVGALREPPTDASQQVGYATGALKSAVLELDGIVSDLVKRGVSLIHLPSSSSLLVDAFIRGSYQFTDSLGQRQTVSYFNGKTLQDRYPNQRFSVSDTNANSIDNTPNVLRFGDVVTQFDPTIVVPKLTALGLGPDNTAIYVINQQGDLGSIENFARLAAMLTSGATPLLAYGGWSQVNSRNLTYSGTVASGSFNTAEADQVVNEIDGIIATMSLNGLARLVVVLNPATHFAGQVAFASVFSDRLAKYTGDARIAIFGLSFAPRAGAGGFSVLFPVARGLQAASIRPTADLAFLGFASDEATLSTQVKSDLAVLDALKFASACRTVSSTGALSGVTGNNYKFIKNTLVAELLHDDGTFASSKQAIASPDSNYRLNGRASGRPAVPA